MSAQPRRSGFLFGLGWFLVGSLAYAIASGPSAPSQTEADNDYLMRQHLRARVDTLTERVLEMQKSCIKESNDLDDIPQERGI